jgi:hypothetical protein
VFGSWRGSVAAALLLASAGVVADESRRFIATGETVADHRTTLEWQRADDRMLYTWRDALSHCRLPWRLPTVEELYTLVDVRRTGPPLIAPIFSSSTGYYWTATPAAGDASQAWYVSFGNGGVGYGTKRGTYRVRCVR